MNMSSDSGEKGEKRGGTTESKETFCCFEGGNDGISLNLAGLVGGL